jgi:hypothetical protein
MAARDERQYLDLLGLYPMVFPNAVLRTRHGNRPTGSAAPGDSALESLTERERIERSKHIAEVLDLALRAHRNASLEQDVWPGLSLWLRLRVILATGCEVVRAARLRSGLTLAELGNRTGYSAAQVSRYERGVTPLRDVSVLRRFARALAISPGELGLAVTGPGGGSGRAPIAAASGVPSRVVPSRVAGEPGGRDEDVAQGSGNCWSARCGTRCLASRRRLRGCRRALCALDWTALWPTSVTAGTGGCRRPCLG